MLDLKWSANAFIILEEFLAPMRLKIAPGVAMFERMFDLKAGYALSEAFAAATYDSTNMFRM